MPRPTQALPRASFVTLALCGMLAAAPMASRAQVPLTDLYWSPLSVLEGLPLLSRTDNWADASRVRGPWSLDSTIAGRFSTRFYFGNETGVAVDSLVTLGSIKVDAGSWKLEGQPGTAAALVLGSDSGQAALRVGPAESADGLSAIEFRQMAVFSRGVATVNSGSDLTLDKAATWAHDGELVIAASANGISQVALFGGSTLSGGLSGSLDLRVGSLSAAILQSFEASTIEAGRLRIGAVDAGAVSQMVINLKSTLRVWNDTLVGDVGGAKLTLGQSALDDRSGTTVWESGRVVVGTSGGGFGHVELKRGTQAVLGDAANGRFADMELGLFGGSQGRLDTAGGASLRINGDLVVGGDGWGMAEVRGALEARMLRVGGAGGSGQFVSRGSVLLGSPATPWSTAATIGGNGSWVHGGTGDVHGNIVLGEYGGSNIVMRLLSGGSLDVHGTLSVGDYHVFDARDTADASLIVESGAVLRFDDQPYGSEVFLYGNALLGGSGTLVGDVWVAGGQIGPGQSPGWLSIDGDLVFSDWGSGGRILIELGGTRPGLDYDVLSVSGVLDLGSMATIEVVLRDGFRPQAGQAFAFVRAGSVLGSFAHIIDHTGLGLVWEGGAFGIDPAAAVPEPGTWALWLLGIAGLGARRWATGSGSPSHGSLG